MADLVDDIPDSDWDILSPAEAAARDLLVQAAHLGLVTVLVLGKNAQGEPALLGTEDLHDWMKVRELLAAMLKRVDGAILEESTPELEQLLN
jgi:hypothetical protein